MLNRLAEADSNSFNLTRVTTRAKNVCVREIGMLRSRDACARRRIRRMVEKRLHGARWAGHRLHPITGKGSNSTLALLLLLCPRFRSVALNFLFMCTVPGRNTEARHMQSSSPCSVVCLLFQKLLHGIKQNTVSMDHSLNLHATKR
jgi:hypothetical protein